MSPSLIQIPLGSRSGRWLTRNHPPLAPIQGGLSGSTGILESERLDVSSLSLDSTYTLRLARWARSNPGRAWFLRLIFRSLFPSLHPLVRPFLLRPLYDFALSSPLSQFEIRDATSPC